MSTIICEAGRQQNPPLHSLPVTPDAVNKKSSAFPTDGFSSDPLLTKTLSGAPSALVIGGGFGGMAAALRLRAKGYAVELIEKLPQLGGKAQVYVKDGFRHDAGPTVITAPFLFAELFTLFGKQLEDYIELKPVNPWYRFMFADGNTFDYGGTVADTLAEIARFNHDDQAGYLKLLATSRAIYTIGFEKLADQPFHHWSSMLLALPHLIRLKCYRSVWQLVCEHIKDPLLRQAFSIQPLLVGGNPFATTSIYSLIHYLERQWGVTFPMGGTGALVNALTRLLQEQGVTIRLNTTIEKILVAHGKVSGVRLNDGSSIAASLVVSNADPAYTYSHLIDRDQQKYTTRLKTRTAKFSMGLFVLYFGTTRTYPNVAHHTIWLGKRYQSLLADIFDKKILAQDFSMYVHRPTATDTSFAPAGCDSFYVLVPVPNLQGKVNWSIEAKELQQRIVSALSRTLLPGLEHYMVADFYKTPEDFHQDYLSLHGAGFSIAPIFRQSAWFRYHNRAEGIQGLYHVGAGTHPGAGLPGVLSSAKVVDHLIPSAVNVKRPSPTDTLRQHGKSFYWASCFLGRKKASQAARLYAFCRMVDDLVDKTPDADTALQTLNRWRKQIQEGEGHADAVQDVLALAQEISLDTTALDYLLQGLISDLTLQYVKDEKQLLQYCFLVAGTVGLMMCGLLGAKDPAAKKFAIDLGIAMQLTNILRDIAEDAAVGRQYIPQSWLAPTINLLKPTENTGVLAKPAFQRLQELAEDYYQSAYIGLRYLPWRSRLSITIAARLYQEIGLQAKRQDFPVLQKRIVVSAQRKCWLIGVSLIRFASGLLWRKTTPSHHAILHSELTPWLERT